MKKYTYFLDRTQPIQLIQAESTPVQTPSILDKKLTTSTMKNFTFFLKSLLSFILLLGLFSIQTISAQDNDNDLVPDISDQDNDNDGILDLDENSCSQTNGMRIVHWSLASQSENAFEPWLSQAPNAINPSWRVEVTDPYIGNNNVILRPTAAATDTFEVSDFSSTVNSADGSTIFNFDVGAQVEDFSSTIPSGGTSNNNIFGNYIIIESIIDIPASTNPAQLRLVTDRFVLSALYVAHDGSNNINLNQGSLRYVGEANGNGAISPVFTLNTNAGGQAYIAVTLQDGRGFGSSILEWSLDGGTTWVPVPIANTFLPEFCDTDGDFIPDYLDLDSDNDGIPDTIEAQLTSTYSTPGAVDPLTGIPVVGSDTDGIDPITSDTDPYPDYLDLDSDDDGISDAIEYGVDTSSVDFTVDTDNDGIPDAMDASGGGTDVNNNGVIDSFEPIDTDGDLVPDYLDLDSDNDGIYDVVEAGFGSNDTNNDGRVSANPSIDLNGNGQVDAFEGQTPPNTVTSTPANYINTDSDGDGCSDSDEAYFGTVTDADSDDDGLYGASPITTDPVDGTVNGAPYDSDNALYVDGNTNICLDTDGDGIPDLTDLDDDNDGIPDLEECGTTLGVSLLPNGDFGVAVTGDSFFNGTGNGGGNPDNYNTFAKPMPAGITTTYGFIPTTPRPADGNYALVTNSAGFSYLASQTIPNFWLDIEDFTIDPTGELGYFALFNADDNPGTFFEQTISALTIGEKYEFTSGIINLFNPGYLDNGTELFLGNTPIPPNVTMTIAETGGNVITQFNSGDIPNDGAWKEISLIFTATTTDVVLSISNNTSGGVGNDFGIDNVSLELVCDSDNDGIPDSLDLDSDNDGIPDFVEAGGTDADGDGQVDGFTDIDNDGLHDPLDNVNNGAPTNEVSNGTPLPNLDSDSDGLIDRLDLDSDNDGIADILEAGGTDANGDGQVDYGTPGDPTTMVDVDQDGFIDTIDTDDNTTAGAGDGGTALPDTNTDGDGLPNRLDLDSDNDGIHDVIESGGTDTDGNGTADDDDDNVDNTASNGIPTSAGGGNIPTDTGADGSADYVNLDSDGDGCSDANEAYADENADGGDGEQYGTGTPAATGTFGLVTAATYNTGVVAAVTDATDTTACGGLDSDGDGINDDVDLDDDNDGIPDTVEGTGDSDGDGIPDYLDLDSDNDGLPDILEAGGTDTDRDGQIDYPTPGDPTSINDSNMDGLDDGIAASPLPDSDSDNDGLVDRLDLDADNDGIADIIEAGGTDANGDGQVDYATPGDPMTMLDGDGDGFIDTIDTNDNTIPGTEDGGTTLPDFDNDQDLLANRLDLDSDNDGIYDVIESGGTDTDGDGRADDDDNNVDNTGSNGIPTSAGGGNTPTDTGTDGSADYINLDSDEDGCSDANEAYGSANADGGDGGQYGTGTPAVTDAFGLVTAANYDTGAVTMVTDATDATACIVLDADGDGVLDTQEIADGTDPNDPCDYVIASITEVQGGDWLLADCDGDGVTNGQEVADGTNPEDPCDFTAANITLALSGDYLISDCDGDGVTNGTEITDGTNPEDPCDFLQASVTLDRSGDWLTADCDGDMIPNDQENTDGTDPNDPCSNINGNPPPEANCNTDLAIETDFVNPDVNNGVFQINNIELYPSNTVRIYNRWGILVFETEGYDNSSRAFRGVSNGRATVSTEKELPVGVYFYIVEYVDDGTTKVLDGYLYVNR